MALNKIDNNLNQDKQISNTTDMPYEDLLNFSENDKEEFKEKLSNLSKPQLYILKQFALEMDADEAIKIIDNIGGGASQLEESLNNLTLQEKYEIAKSTIMPEAFSPEWFDSVYSDMIKYNGEINESSMEKILEGYEDEELEAFATMLENYMRDFSTAELLRKEKGRRKIQSNKKHIALENEKDRNRINQDNEVRELKDSLNSGELKKVDYESVMVFSECSENQKEAFKKEWSTLTKPQLHILRQFALEMEIDDVVKIIDNIGGGVSQLEESLNNLTLQEKYEIAKSTIMPGAFSPEWFNSVYSDMIKYNGEINESSMEEILEGYTDEELGAFSTMLENYMKDYNTAELLRKEKERRKNNE